MIRRVALMVLSLSFGASCGSKTCSDEGRVRAFPNLPDGTCPSPLEAAPVGSCDDFELGYVCEAGDGHTACTCTCISCGDFQEWSCVGLTPGHDCVFEK